MKEFFEYLEKKEGRKIPLRVKLLTGMPLTPEELNVEGDLDLSYSKVTSLPEGLEVGGYLSLHHTSITSLPKGLKVGGSLWLGNTPLSEKYTSEQLKEMYPGIKGKIYSRI